MVCSTTPWRVTAKSSSSTATGASATAGCCRRARCANPRPACARVDAVVVNGGRAPLEGALRMQLVAGDALGLIGGAIKALREFAGHSVHAVAGIGNPERFFNMLRGYGIEVLGHPLPDHARLQAADISFPDGRPVLMTEKDAVKCAAFAGAQHWYVPVTASFEGGESKLLLDIVTRAMTLRTART